MTREEQLSNGFTDMMKGFWKNQDLQVPSLETLKLKTTSEKRTTGNQETCEDAISRQVAIDAFERFIHEIGIEDKPYNYGEMALSIQNVPPVTPQPKIGHWVHNKCDKCGASRPPLLDNYCPNCGAKM